MSSLLSVESSAEVLGTSKNSIMVTACNYKRKNGRYPKWYISQGKRGAGRSFVDIDILDRNRQILRSIWIMCTDYLYWIMSYDFGMTDAYIARQLAKRSEIYKDVSSWRTFIQRELFSTPPEVVYDVNRTMLVEFLMISKVVIALAVRESE